MLISLLSAAAVFIADAKGKSFAQKVADSDKKSVGPAEIVIVHNKGFAMNYMSESPDKVKYICTGVGVGVSAVLLLLSSKGGILSKIAAGLVIGGAAGNISDRYRHGFVVDYIRIPKLPGKFGRVSYNLSDFAILLGTILSIF
ncbi:MAG: signal peptidase II [Lachnospiraceae bacterium]|nr:signal peptidase II [Candidatus Minthocola equi]